MSLMSFSVPQVSVLHLRWLLWFLGALGLGCLLIPKTRQFLTQKLKPWGEQHAQRLLLVLCVGYFLLSVLAKVSQFFALKLNGQDFWLFVDILEHTQRGAPFLTRFAPQASGYVQHGSVHPMWSWGALAGVAYFFGSTLTALLFHPVVLSMAGWFLAQVAQENWSRLSSVAFAFAFFASTQVGKIAMYEVHPEVAYPGFLILWYWAFKRYTDESGPSSKSKEGHSWVFISILVFSSLFFTGIKEDSFLVFFPWLWGCAGETSQRKSKALLGSAGVALVGVGLQVLSVKNWVSGAWGPASWEGHRVLQDAALGEFRGLHWSGLGSVLKITHQFLEHNGGFWGVLGQMILFLTSRSWLSLVILAPWVVGSMRFWMVILPLVGAYSLLDGPKHLWNYYSAPFLGTFWLCAVIQKRARPIASWAPLWSVLAALILGSSSLDFFLPTEEVRTLRSQALTLAPCLRGQGVVASPLLGLVDLKHVLTDRVPHELQESDFFFFLPQAEVFAFSIQQAQALKTVLEAPESGYCPVRSCQGSTPFEAPQVVLFEKCRGKSETHSF